MSQTAPQGGTPTPALRHDWQLDEVQALFDLPFMELVFRAAEAHRAHFDPTTVQISTLINIKTGGCAENCGYCSQSAHHEKEIDIEREALMDVEKVLEAARAARAAGAGRFCMGAAWRSPNKRDMEKVVAMVEGVRGLGMETCVTLGMLNEEQVEQLKEAGLDYYNHNLDTSREYYDNVVTTRTFDDRLATIQRVRDAGINVCSGGILGMGESRRDRALLLQELANLDEHPDSVPINKLVPIKGTPLGDQLADNGQGGVDTLEFVRTIAVARILMPKSWVRLSAGRESMSDEGQALCFLAGANSIFYGDKLLTTGNASTNRDQALFERLGIRPEQVHATH